MQIYWSGVCMTPKWVRLNPIRVRHVDEIDVSRERVEMEVCMKHVWMDNKVDNKVDKKLDIFGLYYRKSIWRKKLLCYFMDKRNAKDTARHMGNGYSICKLQRSPQIRLF
jgi:hypothetical protein